MIGTNLKLITAAAVVALGATAPTGATYGAGTTVAQVAQQTSQAPSGSAATTPSTTLAQAVRAAEERTKARAAKVELEREKGVYFYEVKTVSQDGAVDVFVNFTTGKVDSVNGPGLLDRVGDVFDSEDKREDEAMFKALEVASVSLHEAIDAAVSNTGGRAIEAKLKDRYGSVYYEVSLIVDGSKQKVEVDTTTAKVVAVKARKKGDDDDDDD